MDDVFSWVPIEKIENNTEYLIPAQTVFTSNSTNYKNEKSIIQQTTHGVAGGYSRDDAIRSGICEIIHRHFFRCLVW